MLRRLIGLIASVGVPLALAHIPLVFAVDGCTQASLLNPQLIEQGIGGTGAPQARGIGGTGMPIDRGGIGGTGAPIAAARLLPDAGVGGTGIVGVISGFASVCVNGVEVHYNAQTPVSYNGTPAKLGDLAVGHTVVMTADLVGGQLRARGIAAFDLVSGPVDRFDPATQRVQVMGQIARLENAILPNVRALADGAQVREAVIAQAQGRSSQPGLTQFDQVGPLIHTDR